MTNNKQLQPIQNFPNYSNGTNTSHLKLFLNENNLDPTYFTQTITRKPNEDYSFFTLYDNNKNLIAHITFNAQTGLFSL